MSPPPGERLLLDVLEHVDHEAALVLVHRVRQTAPPEVLQIQNQEPRRTGVPGPKVLRAEQQGLHVLRSEKPP